MMGDQDQLSREVKRLRELLIEVLDSWESSAAELDVPEDLNYILKIRAELESK